jgi:hypothetical protein
MTCMEMRRTSLSMASSAAMDSTPWALARSSGRHRQSRASGDTDRAVAPRAVTPEVAVPSRPRPVPTPTPGLELQVRQPALHIHLWLDHMKTLPKGPASSKRAATDQGGPGAAGGGQGRKEGKYTLDATLTSHASSTAPLAGKRPTPCVSGAS